MELTDDERHWIAVAIENSLGHAEERLAKFEEIGAMDDAMDYGLLVQKYQELQVKFPPPEISKDDIPPE